MFDLEKIPNRDIILEGVYTSLPVFEDAVVNSGVIPQKVVSTESSILPDLSTPIFEVDGRWVYGAEVQTFYKGAGGEYTLRANWWAMKDVYSPDEIRHKVAPELQKPTQKEVLANLKRVITLMREKQFHDLATNTANYASGFSATPATKWDASGADIVSDIQAGIDKLLARGVAPKVLIIPKLVWNKIKFADAFKNLYVDRNYATPKFLQDLFEIPKIVMPAVTTYGKPKKSSAVVATNLWQDDVIIMGNDPLGAGTYPSFVEAVLAPAVIQNLPLDPEKLTRTIIAREAKAVNFIKNDAAYLLHDVLS